MLSISHLLCGHRSGQEGLRYGHARATHARAPRPVVAWALTRACNLRCVHCYASAAPRPDPDELSHHECLAVLEDLRDFQVPAVLFSGGEPLVRPDLLELLRAASRLGLACTLSTNGLLIDEPMAEALANLRLRYVGVSLDGLQPRHDLLRRQKGAFVDSLKAIARCRACGLKVGVRFTLQACNLLDLEAIFDLCLASGVQRLCLYHLAYAGRGRRLQSEDLTPAETRSALDRIFERTRQCHAAGKPLEVLTVGNHTDAAYLLQTLEQEDPARAAWAWGCLRGTGGNRSGQYIAAIDPRGGVHYDQFSWHYTCGNVRREPFSRIWSEAKDPRLALLRNRIGHLSSRCRSCRFVAVCNGNLRTRAEVATGDWLGNDPSCYLREEEIQAKCNGQAESVGGAGHA